MGNIKYIRLKFSHKQTMQKLHLASRNIRRLAMVVGRPQARPFGIDLSAHTAEGKKVEMSLSPD